MIVHCIAINGQMIKNTLEKPKERSEAHRIIAPFILFIFDSIPTIKKSNRCIKLLVLCITLDFLSSHEIQNTFLPARSCVLKKGF